MIKFQQLHTFLYLLISFDYLWCTNLISIFIVNLVIHSRIQHCVIKMSKLCPANKAIFFKSSILPLAINHLGDSGMKKRNEVIKMVGAEQTSIKILQLRIPAHDRMPTVKPPTLKNQHKLHIFNTFAFMREKIMSINVKTAINRKRQHC